MTRTQSGAEAARTIPEHDVVSRRYGNAPAPVSDIPNEVIASLLEHRSVRAFEDRPISDETLKTILTAAQSASTSSNMQNWSVVAVRDPARKNRLADLSGSQQHIRQAPLFLVWLADLSRIEDVGRRNGVDLEGIHYLETLFVGIVDAAIAAQNAVVALESLGLGSVYIGGIRDHPDLVAEELGLPPRVLAVVGLCVGYPDPQVVTGIKPRLPQPVILHEERYSTEGRDEAIASYNASIRFFQEKQKLPALDWTTASINRIRTAADLHGRDNIRAALTKLGFQLR